LIWAAKNGRIPTVIFLIEAGCNCSLKDNKGKSFMDILKENHPGKVNEVQVTLVFLCNNSHFYFFFHKITC